MTTLIALFVMALVFSLVVTPLVKKLAEKLELVDLPADRKIHRTATPRIGGIAVFTAFFLPFFSFLFYSTAISQLLTMNRQTICLVAGACIVFAVGLWDDVGGLKPSVKLTFQLVSTLISYYGGMRIGGVALPWGGIIEMGWISLPVTVIWFLVVINGINLIDGLDGLAAGVTLFTSLVLLILCVTGENFPAAMGFAALSGTTLGFLRYNFNPASIFMGDGGSYFLGYMLAAMAILGSVKSQAAVAILIPIIAMGVPLIEVLWSPVRRFLLGRRVFSPDKEHLHHRLLELGFSQRLAVSILYGITVALGIMAIIMVHASNEQASLILIMIGAAMILGMRKLGYFEYFAVDKVYSWLKDVTDQAGITFESRSFLDIQMDIGRSATLIEVWQTSCRALKRLDFDMAELYLIDDVDEIGDKSVITPMVWVRESFDLGKDVDETYLLKLELPLVGGGGENLGTLRIVKDLKRDAISYFTLRRVEQLRRTLLGTLKKIKRSRVC